ncbi:MAG: hypothetical protein ACYTG0_25040 [Planctomycetota bacterium]|jgi:DnaJ-class molecular chaperone
MSRPYVCPLCGGSGELPTDQTCPTKRCHACAGKGIVWSPDPEPVPVPGPYPTQYYQFTCDAAKGGTVGAVEQITDVEVVGRCVP